MFCVRRDYYCPHSGKRQSFLTLLPVMGGGLLGFAAALCQLNTLHKAQAERPAQGN
jgi:hypothetical protein